MTSAGRRLTNRQWAQMSPLLPGMATDPGRTGSSTRNTLEGIIWVLRTGVPWRDIPRQFGQSNTIHRRFRRWVADGVFDLLFDTLSADRDLQAVMVDGTFAKVHQHGVGAHREGDLPAESAKRQAIGRSRGGLTTKVMAMTVSSHSKCNTWSSRVSAGVR